MGILIGEIKRHQISKKPGTKDPRAGIEGKTIGESEIVVGK
jgi:hypothetical protein